MKIAKTAVKLNRFKNLMAHTTSISLTASPILLLKSLPALVPGASPTLFTLLAAGTLFSQLGIIIYRLLNYVEKTNNVFTAATWKKAFDLPFLIKAELDNEKTILLLRDFSTNKFTEQETLTAKQQQEFTKLYVAHMLNVPQVLHWATIQAKEHNKLRPIDTQLNFDLGFDLGEMTKYSQLHKKIKAIVENNPQLKPSIVQETQKLTQNPNIHLKLITLLTLESQERQIKSRLSVPHCYTDYRNFLLENGYQLKKQDYKGIFTLMRGENSSILEELFDFLFQHPQAVQWNKIATEMKNYRFDDNFYQSYLPKIKKLATEQNFEEGQEKILTKAQQEVSGRTMIPPTPQGVPALNTTALPLVEQEVNNYLQFQPEHFIDKWNLIKDNFIYIQQHRQQFDKTALHQFSTDIKGSLGILILTDQSLKEFSPKQRQISEKLLSDNLDLCVIQTTEMREKIGEQHIKALEANKLYQKAKLG